MKIIEVKSDKINKMSEMVEDMLMMGGKLMHCLEELESSSMYGERGIRMKDSRYGKMERPDEDDDYGMYERRGRRNY